MTDITRRGLLTRPAASRSPEASRRAPAPAAARAPRARHRRRRRQATATTIEFWSNHPGHLQGHRAEADRRFQKANPGLKVNLIDAGKNYEEVGAEVQRRAGRRRPARRRRRLRRHLVQLRAEQAPSSRSTTFSATGSRPRRLRGLALRRLQLPDGKHYALPYARSTPLFYYNKDVWKKAGLPDRGPAAWDEFDDVGPAAAGRRSAPASRRSSWATASDYLDWTFQGIDLVLRRRVLRPVDPEVHRRGYHRGRQVPAGLSQEEVRRKTSARLARATSPPDLGATLLQSTGDLVRHQEGRRKFEFGTAFLPAPNGATCPTGGAGLAIPQRHLRRAQDERDQVHRVRDQRAEHRVLLADHRVHAGPQVGAAATRPRRRYLAKNPNSSPPSTSCRRPGRRTTPACSCPVAATDIGQALDQIVAGCGRRLDVHASGRQTTIDRTSRQIKPLLKA